MCGIAGFTGGGDASMLERMTAAIRHRGPDASGHWQDERTGVYLGHRRLSIIDLAGGAQPMWTQDAQFGIVFNGEIYNHVQLRQELRASGCVFVSDHSDTEVLLHAYRKWGDGFVERLNGMWAFVIYDRARQRLFGSRDRFGKKPLYYFHEKGVFGWASELPALLQHPACPRSVSPLAVKKYFAYCYIPAPRSIYERVWKLPGGHCFSFDLPGGVLKTWRYWEFVLETDPSLAALAAGRNETPLEELCSEIRGTLEGAVQRRLMSDVPLGVFLSGGLDSSAIAALAAKHLPPGGLHTFSIGFNDPSFDESSHARTVAAFLGTQHCEEMLDLDRSTTLLPELISRLDEPLGDSSLLPTYLLAQFTRKHVTVALGGDGGDELFAGYDPFRALRAAEAYQRLIPRRLHQAIRMCAARLPVSHRNISLDFKIKRTLQGLSYPPPLWNAVWMSALDPHELVALFQEPSDPEEIYSEAIAAWDGCRQPNIVDRTLQFFTNLYLADGILPKVDRATMLCSLEARSPFLDLEFVNLARRIPWQLKLRGGETKWILKKALAPLLPGEIVNRPKKGFGMPVGRWLREGRFDCSAAPAPLGMDREFIQSRYLRHQQERVDDRLFLWSYWLLEQWMKK